MNFITRFAPSPSGYLHLGHVFAACEARRLADELGGHCLIRIEDIDTGRCHQKYIEAIFEDMEWLGLVFDGEVIVQSTRLERYGQVLDELKYLGVLYPCFCTRKSIAREISEMSRAPQGQVIDDYPGKCRHLTEEQRRELIESGVPHSWRLNCRKAAELTGILYWNDIRFGGQQCNPLHIGDVILGRKDCPASYHIAVVVDDADQNVTHVTRGEDLLASTHVHRTLQALLGLNIPTWYHHKLVTDSLGKRLAKRDKSLSIKEMRSRGLTPGQILKMVECK